MMKFHSTRGDKSFDFSQAIALGLAEQGGLFIPEKFPDLSCLVKQEFKDFSDFAVIFLKRFLEGGSLDVDAQEIIKQALNFPLKHKTLSKDLSVLELFHGPTLSFKDFGARFLAKSLEKNNKKLCILVATSGDTGSAVASSFHGLKNINVIVLFPKGKITQRQQAQITCWGDNILAVEVEGVFDDCQALVKQAFSDDWFKSELPLSTANSINIGRLLPQMSYYAYTAIKYFKKKSKSINYIIPGGNLGNATACIYVKQMNLPIGDITIATNDNKTLVNYFDSGNYHTQPTVETIANAMDVGAPSNFERLDVLFNGYKKFKSSLNVYSVNDEQIRQSIFDCFERYQYLICPHTATAYFVAKNKSSQEQCIVSTAHPAKFETIIEPIIKQPIKVPENLKELLDKPQQSICIQPNIESLKQAIISSKKIDLTNSP